MTGSSRIRNRVNAVGIVMRIGISSVKRRVDALGKIPTDSTNAHEFLDACFLQSPQATEVLEQRRAPVRSDARNLLETRRLPRPLATATMAGDRETMRLVAHRLDQVRSGRLRPRP